MKFRYLLVPVFEDEVTGTNDEAVMNNWIHQYGDEAVIVIDLAAMQFTDIAGYWQAIKEHKQ